MPSVTFWAYTVSIRKKIAEDEIQGLVFEINQLFTPSTPIKLGELFAGRLKQVRQMQDAVAEPGRHIVLYGERGVGKTSIAQVLRVLLPASLQKIVYSRKACSPDDDFDSIWRKFFKDMRFSISADGENETYSVDELYPARITPDDVLRELNQFNAAELPIFVIDEYNEVRDVETSSLLANTIKTLSDEGNSATVVTVGVADDVTELFSEHQSISRCTEEILMPRMSNDELGEILDKRIGQLGLGLSRDARWKIVILARGLPTYVHRLGKFAATRAVYNRRTTIDENDVEAAIEEMLTGSLQSLRDAYEQATHSNQPGNLFKEILLACALSKADDNGYFMPASVRDPLSKIVGKPMEISQYRSHLSSFVSEKRGAILQRIGQERSYRFRFVEPTMQPYVLMKGITTGMINKEARAILRFPEQRDLFPSEP